MKGFQSLKNLFSKKLLARNVIATEAALHFFVNTLYTSYFNTVFRQGMIKQFNLLCLFFKF